MDAATSRKLLRSVLLVFLVLFVGTLLTIAAVITLEGPRRSRIDALLLTALALAFAALIILGSLFAFSRRRGRIAAVCGVVSALAMLGLALVLIWGRPPYPLSEVYGCWCASAATWAAAAGAAALLAVARLPANLRFVQYLARGAVPALALGISAAISDEYRYLPSPFRARGSETFRIVIVGSILTGCLLLSVPLLHWFNALRERAAVTTALRLWLRCPRCGREQELAAGGATCAQCRLRLRIEIEEERCPACGYLLYRLVSANCPECGTPIPAYTAADARAPGGP